MLIRLSNDDFSDVIKNTPLISIDLIIKNESGCILLGKRTNEPAKNFWFVPGGRILKNEEINDAFQRIFNEEVGCSYDITNAKFLGVYQHFYDNNVFNGEFTTHYIVLAYEVSLSIDLSILPDSQHNSFKWFTMSDVINGYDIHSYTKDYFLIG